MSKEKLEELLNEAARIYDAPDMAQVAEHLIKNNVFVLQRDAAQEQIDELESVLYEANHKKSVLDYRWLATAAYNAGYRKQSENTVVVVRCKDCVFCEEGQGACIYCRLHDTRFERNGFCSYGKMKGGAE